MDPFRRLLKLPICLGMLLLTACSYKQNQVLLDGGMVRVDTSYKAADVPLYKIHPQDMLQVRNLQSIKYIADDILSSNGQSPASASEAVQSYRVEDDGNIALPVLGRVAVGGLTRADAAKKIEDLYRKTVLKDPIIEVTITNLKVMVFGEVRSPGIYQLVDDRTSLVEVLGKAGGITEKGNEKQIKIIRGGSINPQTYVIDMGKVSALTNPISVLQNKDIIYVSQNKRAIRNDNLQNVTTIMQPALLLMNTALIFYTLSR